jgi:hypothetical protein
MMEGTMKALGIAPICAALACLAISITLHEAKAQEPKLTRIRMTADELAAHGLAVRELRMRPFPNSCASSGNRRLSVSDEFLAHFRARGFTLESLCLGLSSHMHFDPETGRQLPLAYVPEVGPHSRDADIPLNLPGCFRNAVPHLECDSKFDTWEVFRLEPHDNPRPFARKFDVLVRQYIQRTGVSGVFKVEDLGQGLFTSSYEWLLASSALPRGYGYALHGPEGDDPEVETVNLSTYRKKSDVGSIWSDER